MKATARAHYVLVLIVLVLVTLQFVFGGLIHFTGPEFIAHYIVGDLIALIALIALIVSLVAKRARGWTAGLFVAAFVQPYLPGFAGSMPILAALHFLNPVLMLYLAIAVLGGGRPSLPSASSEGTRARTA